MAKPDRFARAVENVVSDGWSSDAYCVAPQQASKLLRRQFMVLRRLVTKQQQEIEEGPDPEHPINRAHHLALTNVLTELDAWKKGTR
jgi:hypothetical protein